MLPFANIRKSRFSAILSSWVGRPVCSQVSPRGGGFQSLLTSLTGQFPSDPSAPPQGKSLGRVTTVGVWDIQQVTKRRGFKNFSDVNAQELRKALLGSPGGGPSGDK